MCLIAQVGVVKQLQAVRTGPLHGCATNEVNNMLMSNHTCDTFTFRAWCRVLLCREPTQEDVYATRIRCGRSCERADAFIAKPLQNHRVATYEADL